MTMLMEGVLSLKVLLIVLVAITVVFIHSLLSEKEVDVFDFLSRRHIVVRWGTYYIMLMLIQISMSYVARTEAFMYAVF